MDLVTVIRRVQRKKAERERANTRAFCLMCKEHTTLVSVAAAIETHRITLNEISQSVADGTFHRIHNRRGEILFCGHSLHQSASRSNETQPMRTEFLRSMKAAA